MLFRSASRSGAIPYPDAYLSVRFWSMASAAAFFICAAVKNEGVPCAKEITPGVAFDRSSIFLIVEASIDETNLENFFTELL